VSNEKLLFNQVAAGNEQAFTTLFNIFLPKLYPFIIRFSKSEAATKEIVQETFLRVWLNRDKLDAIDNPGGWLFKVAMNECYAYMRKQLQHDNFFTAITENTDLTATAYEWIDTRELNRLVQEAVEQLPAQRKKIYQLSRTQGKSIPEIAELLALSPNTVKNALVTSLKFIRTYLEQHGDIILLIGFCLAIIK
jgi:RNA polymerase sigma-70 factor (family 1)